MSRRRKLIKKWNIATNRITNSWYYWWNVGRQKKLLLTPSFFTQKSFKWHKVYFLNVSTLHYHSDSHLGEQMFHNKQREKEREIVCVRYVMLLLLRFFSIIEKKTEDYLSARNRWTLGKNPKSISSFVVKSFHHFTLVHKRKLLRLIVLGGGVAVVVVVWKATLRS